MSFTIAFTVSAQREKYLRQALDSWGKVRGIQDAHLLFCMEPRPVHSPFPVGEFKAFLQRSFRSTEVIVNDVRKGCFANTRDTMRRAFADGASFTILAEEDLVVADDLLEYFTWAQRYRDDEKAIAVCSHVMATSGLPGKAVRVPWFSPLVWGTWPDRWEQFILPGWGGIPGNPEAWDHHLRTLIHEGGLCSLFPAWSRSEHIGRASTLTPGALSEHFFEASTSQCFRPHYEPQDWQELPPDSFKLVV